MAVIRQNLELLSPEEGDSDGARQNKITFYGFKDGDADFNDVTSGIGPTSQTTGTGLNDATFGGVYSGASTKTYAVKITATGTPDSFQYSSDNGSTYNGVNIQVRSDGVQNLAEGVNIIFGATTGHTLNDVWKSTVIVPLTFSFLQFETHFILFSFQLIVFDLTLPFLVLLHCFPFFSMYPAIF